MKKIKKKPQLLPAFALSPPIWYIALALSYVYKTSPLAFDVTPAAIKQTPPFTGYIHISISFRVAKSFIFFSLRVSFSPCSYWQLKLEKFFF